MAVEAQVEVRGLTMAYGDTVIQRDLSFAVARGEIFVIMGDSGGGKQQERAEQLHRGSPPGARRWSQSRW